MNSSLTITATVLVSLLTARADLLDKLGLGKKTGNESALPGAGAAALPQGQVVQGLKEALGKGVQKAVSQLGHEGGFLTNQSVKIPMPEKLRTVEKTLRALTDKSVG
jgi:hypothetical protein